MGVISWIILGLIAGFIGSKILNRSGSGLILDLVLGMVGAAVGGFIFSGLFGMSGVTVLNIWSIIVSDWRDHRAVCLREDDREILTRSGSLSVRPSSWRRRSTALRRRIFHLDVLRAWTGCEIDPAPCLRHRD
jgi:uncharacterized membrane protein YeaQ/YmgE (transglycosylase-associated protein family)